MTHGLASRLRSNWVPIAVGAGAVAATAWWITHEHGVPGWDQAQYLDNALRYQQASGVGDLVHRVYTTSPGRAPLFPLLLTPFFALFGASTNSALLLHLLLWPVLLVLTGSIANALFGRAARVVAMFVVATMPLLVGLSHSVLQEFLMATLVTAAVWLMLRLRPFHDTTRSAGLGVVLGLGMLTKVTFAVFVAGPLLVVLVAAWVDRDRIQDRGQNRKLALNVVVVAAAALVVAGIWYVPSWPDTIEYLRLNSSDSLATVGVRQSVGDFGLQVINEGLSWWFAVLGLLAAVLVVPRAWRAAQIRGDRWARWRPLLVLGAWIVVPAIVVAGGKLQNPRYLAAAMPAVAIVLAGLVTKIEWRNVRRVVTAAIVAAGILQSALLLVPLDLPWVPDAVTFPTPFGRGQLSLAGQPQGEDRLPNEVDRVTPIIEYLERISRWSDGSRSALSVGVLQTQVVTNPAALEFVADVRGDPFTFHRQLVDPKHADRLPEELASRDVLLYIPVSQLASNDDRRAGILNRRYYATAYVNAAVLAGFERLPATFVVGPKERVVILRRTESAAASKAISLAPYAAREKSLSPPCRHRRDPNRC